MRVVWIIGALLLLAATARAQPVGAPRVAAGDTWTYQDTIETRSGWRQTRTEATVVRAGPSAIAMSTKQLGSTMPPTEQLTGPDWSRRRGVNGHETTVNKPLSFPLTIGKTWDVEYTEDNPNREHTSEHFLTPYKVTGWDDVTVPAGTFHALKVESDGEWSAAMAPAVSAMAGTRLDRAGALTLTQMNRVGASTVSGRTYKAFWYVPAVKRWVKAVEDYYDANGVRTSQYLDELISFKVSG